MPLSNPTQSSSRPSTHRSTDHGIAGAIEKTLLYLVDLERGYRDPDDILAGASLSSGAQYTYLEVGWCGTHHRDTRPGPTIKSSGPPSNKSHDRNGTHDPAHGVWWSLHDPLLWVRFGQMRSSGCTKEAALQPVISPRPRDAPGA